MTSKEPFWSSRVTCRANCMGQSSRNNEDTCDFPSSCVTHQPNSRFQASGSLDTVSEVDDFQEIFGVFMDVQDSTTSSVQVSTGIAPELKTSRDPENRVLRKCLSDGTQASLELERGLNGDRPKRTRSSELHNMSERRRRDRINRRLRTLQALIPNCNKSDRASVLDDAVNYIKALKLQIELMSTGSGTTLQAPYMSPSGIQTTQVPQILPFVSVRPELGMSTGVGMGMAGMTYASGIPMISVPLASLRPSLAPGVGFPLMSAPGNLAVHQVQMPYVHSQTLTPSADTSSRLPNFATGFSPTFSFSSQEESGSQAIANVAIEHQHMQLISQECHPSVSSPNIPTSHKTNPSISENVAISEGS